MRPLPLTQRPLPRRRDRRGVALMLTIILTVAFAALAMGAIYMTGNASLIGSSYDRERDYRYGAEAALGIAKSQLNGGLFVLPDTGYSTIMSNATITGADGLTVPRVLVNLYAGPTGSTSGQDGTFASLVAEATDGSGARYVRRLELTQETFAKFAYFSVREKNALGGTIVFGGGDVIYGPLFTDDTITIGGVPTPAATFRDQVQTARIIVNPLNAAFSAYGYQQNVQPVALPSDARLVNLAGFASAANFLFTAQPATARVTPPAASYAPPDTSFMVNTRIEFLALDLDNDASVTQPQDGFFRVYNANTVAAVNAYGGGMRSPLNVTPGSDDQAPRLPPGANLAAYVRGDPPNAWVQMSTGAGGSYYSTRWDTATTSLTHNCGDWHAVDGTILLPLGRDEFFPASVHNKAWFQALMLAAKTAGGAGMTAANATTHVSQLAGAIMNRTDNLASLKAPVCYPGGDPHLVAIERYKMPGYAAAAYQRGGEDTTFTPVGYFGSWTAYPGAVDPRLAAAGAATFPRSDRSYLFPLYRGINPNSRGVIQVNGSVGVSGVVRGRITLYANGGTIVILDHVKYAINPSGPDCLGERDILGMIASYNVTIANNALLDPQYPIPVSPSSSGNISTAAWKTFNPSGQSGLTLHGVVMTLSNGFRNEGFRGGGYRPDVALCGAAVSGRGCLNLVGGILMDTRGAVGLVGATGYVKRYAYDRCAATRPPPYFPTTGRFADNRFYELDPVKFNNLGVAGYYRILSARP